MPNSLITIGIHGLVGVEQIDRALLGTVRYAQQTAGLAVRDFCLADAMTSEREFAPPWR